MIDLKKAYSDSSLHGCGEYDSNDNTYNFLKESLIDLKGMKKLASLTNCKNKFIISSIDSTGKIVFSVNPNEVAKKASIEDIRDLISFGILYDSINVCFYMHAYVK